jgi:hypothetical protein
MRASDIIHSVRTLRMRRSKSHEYPKDDDTGRRHQNEIAESFHVSFSLGGLPCSRWSAANNGS